MTILQVALTDMTTSVKHRCKKRSRKKLKNVKKRERDKNLKKKRL